MTDPVALAIRLAADIKVVWHGTEEHQARATRDICDQITDPSTFYLVGLALADTAARQLRRAAPKCTKPGHDHTATEFVSFDASTVPDGPPLQAVRASIAMCNRDRDTAAAIVNVYGAEPNSEGAEFILQLISLIRSFHLPTCPEVHP